MEYRRFSDALVIRLDRGDEVVSCLTEAVKKLFFNEEISMSFSFYPDEETLDLKGTETLEAKKYALRSIWD